MTRLRNVLASSRSDRGIGTLEVLGIVMTAVLLVSGILVVQNKYPDKISNAFCQFGAAVGYGGDCEDGSSVADGGDDEEIDHSVPPKCKLYEESETNTVEGSFLWFDVGTSSSFIVREYSDGTVKATIVDGISADASYEFDPTSLAGKDSPGVSVDVGGGAEFNYGDTWEFESADEWKEMQDQLEEYRDQEKWYNKTGRGMTWWIDRDLVDEPREADISLKETELHVNASGEVDLLGGGDGNSMPGGNSDDSGGPDINAKAELEAQLSGSVLKETDRRTGETETTYEFSAEGGAGVDISASQDLPGDETGGVKHGADAEVMGGVEGAFSVTRDEDGEVTEIEFETMYEYGADANINAGHSDEWSEDGTDYGTDGKGGAGHKETNSRVTKTTLDVTDDNRDTVEDWLGSSGGAGEAAKIPMGAVIPDEPSDDPFEQLLYDEASVGQVDYKNIENKEEFEAKIKAGMRLGFSVSHEESTAEAVDAYYLSNKGQDGVRPMEHDSECHYSNSEVR